MFCPHCGNQVTAAGNFCVQCGHKLSASTSLATSQPPSTQFADETPHNLGTPATVWKKTRVRPRHKSKPPFDLEWLWSETDVVLTNDAVILVGASPVSKVYSSAEAVSNLAIAAGAVGGALLVALPVAVVAEAYEKLFGRHNSFEENALRALFDVGRVLWVRKRNARFRYFEVAGGLFGECSNICVISGSFHHKQESIETCIVASDNVLPRFSDIRKGFEKPGYQIEHVRTKASADVEKLLDQEYPFPNWSKLLGG